MKADAASSERWASQIRINAVRTLPDEPGTSPSDALAGARAPTPVVTRNERVSALWSTWWPQVRWPLGIYALSRVLMLVLAVVETWFRPHNLWAELGNWDGVWYIRIFTHGLPEHDPPLPESARVLPAVPAGVLGAGAHRERCTPATSPTRWPACSFRS